MLDLNLFKHKILCIFDSEVRSPLNEERIIDRPILLLERFE